MRMHNKIAPTERAQSIAPHYDQVLPPSLNELYRNSSHDNFSVDYGNDYGYNRQ